MRCNPLRWLCGIIPLLMLLFVVVVAEFPRMEADLKQRSDAALSEAGLEWASTRFDGRDVFLAGRAPEDGDPEKAVQLLRGTWGVRVVYNQAQLIEKADVYAWSGALRDGKLRLGGYVPNERARKTILDAAKAAFPTTDIVDRMTLARGAPQRRPWLAGIDFGLKQLAQLGDGEVALKGTSLELNGRARTASGYKGVTQALSSGLPQGVGRGAIAVTPPLVAPYTWAAQFDGRQVQLTGHVPSETQRGDVFASAKAAFPKSLIVDRTEVADGAPRDWRAATALALRELARVEKGTASLRDSQLRFEGTAATDAQAEEIRKSLRANIPGAIQLSDAIGFRERAIPTISPYRTSLEERSGRIFLSGYAPSKEAGEALAAAAAARFEGRRIVNRLEIGQGAPRGWQRCMEAGMLGVRALDGGAAALEGRTLRVTGETTDEGLYADLPGRMRRAAPEGCEVDSQASLREVPEPRLNWSASFADVQVVLRGVAANAETKARLAAAAKRLFPGAEVVDRSRSLDVTAKRWPLVAEAGLEMLARLRSGTAEIDGMQLTIKGDAPSESVARNISSRLDGGIGQGYNGRQQLRLRTDAVIAAEEAEQRRIADEARRRAEASERDARAIDEARRRAEDEARRAAEDARRRADDERARVALLESTKRAEEQARRRLQEERERSSMARRQAAAEACQVALRAAAKTGIILFETASSSLSGSSTPVLLKVAEAARQCPDVVIEIEGHTDSDGDADRNKLLSERRAKAVADRLISLGVNGAKLQAIGYGQERPMVSNDTEEGKAQNRRIQFTVKLR